MMSNIVNIKVKMKVSSVLVADLLKCAVVLLNDNIVIKRSQIEKSKMFHYQHRKLFGDFCFPGNIVFAECCDVWYLVYGYRKMRVIAEIAQETPEANKCCVTVEVHQCGSNWQLLYSIYALLNHRQVATNIQNAHTAAENIKYEQFVDAVLNNDETDLSLGMS